MTSTILDEYCRYYSDFSKILGIYIKNFHPQLTFDVEQLLDASYNVWHRLTDEEKISLATFLQEINDEQDHRTERIQHLIDSKLLTKKSPSLRISPFQIYLKEQRETYRKKHRHMSMRQINQQLSLRWQKMSHQMKEKYRSRSTRAKKRQLTRLEQQSKNECSNN